MEKLSKEVSYALRHGQHPVILKVETRKSAKAGIKFYYGNETVWLADRIPFEYVCGVGKEK